MHGCTKSGTDPYQDVADALARATFAGAPARPCLIAGAWAGAFGVLALADLLWMRRPDWPLAVPLAIGGAGLLAAFAFTRWLTSRSVSTS